MDINKATYRQLSELGSKYNLSFSSHEVMSDRIVGLDGINRKLLIAEQNNVRGNHTVIDLQEISSISVKDIYKSIRAGALQKSSIKHFLDSISIKFDYRDQIPPYILPVYESQKNDFKDLYRLEKKAMVWQSILSKMIDHKFDYQETERRKVRIEQSTMPVIEKQHNFMNL